jgi:hypothetical protein
LYLSKVDAITVDLLPTLDITLQASEIPLPANWNPWWGTAGAGGIGSSIVFDRASIASPESSSTTLVLKAGSAIRLRPMIVDMHPASPPQKLAVQVVPPCTMPCAASEQRCPNDTVCYATGEVYCLRCQKRAPNLCACVVPKFDDRRGIGGRSADYCDYMTSADTVMNKTCQNGTCS